MVLDHYCEICLDENEYDGNPSKFHYLPFNLFSFLNLIISTIIGIIILKGTYKPKYNHDLICCYVDIIVYFILLNSWHGNRQPKRATTIENDIEIVIISHHTLSNQQWNDDAAPVCMSFCAGTVDLWSQQSTK